MTFQDLKDHLSPQTTNSLEEPINFLMDFVEYKDINKKSSHKDNRKTYTDIDEMIRDRTDSSGVFSSDEVRHFTRSIVSRNRSSIVKPPPLRVYNNKSDTL